MRRSAITAPPVLIERVARAIHLIRGHRVMLDTDLAAIYGVTTTRLNEQVKRNRGRFPTDFVFQLTPEEHRNLISQIATSSSAHGGRRKLPYAFTEHGAVMLAAVLGTPSAVQASVQVVRAFQNSTLMDKPLLPQNDYRFTLYPPILAKR